MSVGSKSLKRVSASMPKAQTETKETKGKSSASPEAKPKAASGVKPAKAVSAVRGAKTAPKAASAEKSAKKKSKKPAAGASAGAREKSGVRESVLVPMPETVRVMSNIICEIPTYLL